MLAAAGAERIVLPPDGMNLLPTLTQNVEPLSASYLALQGDAQRAAAMVITSASKSRQHVSVHVVEDRSSAQLKDAKRTLSCLVREWND